MFALTGLDNHPPYVNLKCDPELAVGPGGAIRGYMAVIPYEQGTMELRIIHRQHPRGLVLELIDHSDELIVQGLKKMDREEFEPLESKKSRSTSLRLELYINGSELEFDQLPGCHQVI